MSYFSSYSVDATDISFNQKINGPSLLKMSHIFLEIYIEDTQGLPVVGQNALLICISVVVVRGWLYL